MRQLYLAGLVALLAAVESMAQPGRPSPPGSTPPRPRRVYFYPSATGGTPVRPAIIAGYNPRVRVLHEPRFDWSFALSPASRANTPREALLGHDSMQTIYPLWVPTTYRHAVPHGLVLFLSARAAPDEQVAWDAVCRTRGLLFASVHHGGNDAHPGVRLRLALDVLDDVRRRMNIDTDRIYVGGFSEGARTACEVGFSFPEFIGGVIAIGGADSPRAEPWMRERVKERLGVALITGELDPARREIEVWRHPVLREQGVNVKAWTVPRMGHAMPPGAVLDQAITWLEMGRMARRMQGVRYPPMRMAETVVPAAEPWALGVVEEAQRRLKDPTQREAGLMQLEGVVARWGTTGAAREAEKHLEAFGDRDKISWRKVRERRQQEFFAQEARALEEYLAGPLPPRDLLRKGTLLVHLVGVWEQVEKYGRDTREGQKATKRLEELRKIVPGG